MTTKTPMTTDGDGLYGTEEQEERIMSLLYDDPISQTNADSITALRILDLLYAIYAKMDEKGFRQLVEKHRSGGLIGPQVDFNTSEILDR